MSLFKLKWCTVFFLIFFAKPVFSYEWLSSGKSEEIANPFIMVGFDQSTRVLTGYVKTIRIAPGRTDECSIVFFGNLQKPDAFAVSYLDEIDSSAFVQNAALTVQHGQPILKIRKPIAQADCEWILPFVGEPRIHELPEEITLSLGAMMPGDWLGVYVVKSPCARFHKSPDGSTVQNSFIVKGDIVRVYKWIGNWCYVKYEKRGRTTAGWLKRTDLLFR